MTLYFDLSVSPASQISLNHLIPKLQTISISTIAIDFVFPEGTILPLPEIYQTIKELAEKSGIRIQSRATLTLSQSDHLLLLGQNSSNAPAHQYDIIAVRPKNQKLFHTVCVDYDAYDLISLDSSSKLTFMLKRNPVMQSLNHGKFYELNYRAMLNDTSRLTCMTNFINIFKATNCNSIVVSSGGESLAQMRSPFDVAALMIGLGAERGKVSQWMSTNSENLIKAAIHRKFFKGMIKEIPLGTVRKLNKKIKKHKQNLIKLHKQHQKEKEIQKKQQN